MEGQIDDGTADIVWLVANDRRIAVQAENGRFRHVLPVLEPSLVFWAETRTPGGQPLKWSRPVTVHAASRSPSGAVLMIAWPRDAAVVRADTAVMWRQRPDRVSAPVQRRSLDAVKPATDRGVPEVFHLIDLKPGVYTLLLRYEVLGTVSGVRAVLHLSDAGQLKSRELPIVPLTGAGSAVLARVLLPHMVYWDQDEWFSGKSRSGDTVTKFRFPEGVAWTERLDPK